MAAPWIRVSQANGMCALTVKKVFAYAKEHCVSGKVRSAALPALALAN